MTLSTLTVLQLLVNSLGKGDVVEVLLVRVGYCSTKSFNDDDRRETGLKFKQRLVDWIILQISLLYQSVLLLYGSSGIYLVQAPYLSVLLVCIFSTS